jgi:hypothetical protein
MTVTSAGGGVAMHLGVSGRVHGDLVHSWGVLNQALLVVAGGLAALVISWIVYMVVVAAFLL